MNTKSRNLPALVAMGAALIGAILVFAVFPWSALPMKVQLQDLAGLLAPVAFASAVIERAVEILISPWRDAEANRLERALANLKARPASEDEIEKAAVELDQYRRDTQHIAFGVSLVISTLVAMTGVRALGVFLPKEIDPKVFTEAQMSTLRSVDVALTAAMLAGGADGVHSVLSAVTSYFNATADKASKSAAQ